MSDIRKLFHEYKQNRKRNRVVFFKRTTPKKTKHKIAIVVSFRDPGDGVRNKQRDVFLNHYKEFLKDYQFRIFIIEQSQDGRPFNRGKLLNIGSDLAIKQGYDIIIHHDVDLLAEPDMLPYYVIKYRVPCHLAYRWKDKYDFETFIGGIMSFTPRLLMFTNGYPNNEYGWGKEDDMLYNRIAQTIGIIARPSTGTIRELKHGNTELSEKIRLIKMKHVLDDLKHWREDGLSNLEYQVLNMNDQGYYISYLVQL